MKNEIRARPIGRLFRFLAGAALTLVSARYLIAEPPMSSLRVAGLCIGLLLFYVGLQLTIAKYASAMNRCLGAVIGVVPLILLYSIGGAAAQLAVLLYVGMSLVVAGIRADGGCEVMTLPGILLGYRTHLACLVFSPLDWIEEKVSRAPNQDRSASNP